MATAQLLSRKLIPTSTLDPCPSLSTPPSLKFQVCLSNSAPNFPVCVGSLRTTMIMQQQKRKFCVEARAKKGGSSGDKGPRYDPLFAEGGRVVECPVPWDQQPVNEYQFLIESWLFPWATDGLWAYGSRLTAVGVVSSVLAGWVLTMSFNPEQEAMKYTVGALCGGILAATLTALRLYLGWAYVGNRLFSATVEYEETGWYDGEVWVKPPEVLARDRLLGSYKVKPALMRLKLTLVGLGISLIAGTVLLLALPGPYPRVHPVVEHEEGTISRTSRLPYNDGSARQFEPEAFVGDEDVSRAMRFDAYHQPCFSDLEHGTPKTNPS